MPSFPAPPARSAAIPASREPRPILSMTACRFRHDVQRVAVPRVEAQLVVRFGPTIPGGLDIHVMGVRPQVSRKFIRGGQHAVFARLQPGTYAQTLGIPATELTGRVVALEDLWTRAEVQALLEQLAGATDVDAACARLDAAVSQHAAGSTTARAASPLLPAVLEQLRVAGVARAARSLGISERQLRRIVHEALGIGPKTFSRLIRFEHAVRAARSAREINWSSIAADAGYCDQAHLIADFHAIAGNTPRRLMAELMQDEAR